MCSRQPNVSSGTGRKSGEAWWTQPKLDLSGPLFEAQRMLNSSGDLTPIP